jgi:thioredoxin-related protein
MEIIKANEIEEFGAVFPDRKKEIFSLKENYDKLIEKLEFVWVELKELRPKNITPEEKKKYAKSVFDITAKHDVKNFTGLYFGLNDGKIQTVLSYIQNMDNRELYKIL